MGVRQDLFRHHRCGWVSGDGCRYPRYGARVDCRHREGETCCLEAAGDGPWTLGEVGTLLGVTRERVRQIEQVALRKLSGLAQHPVWRERIRDVLEDAESVHDRRADAWAATVFSLGEDENQVPERPKPKKRVDESEHEIDCYTRHLAALMADWKKRKIVLALRDPTNTAHIIETSKLCEGTVYQVIGSIADRVGRERRRDRHGKMRMQFLWQLKPEYIQALDVVENSDDDWAKSSREIVEKTLRNGEMTVAEFIRYTGIPHQTSWRMLLKYAEKRHAGRNRSTVWGLKGEGHERKTD